MKIARTSPTVFVCQASTCRNVGSEAALLEIEELARGLGECTIRKSGCLGACGKGPNAIVVKRGKERLYTGIRDANVSTAVVRHALGKLPRLDDPDIMHRLHLSRQMRLRCNYSPWCLEAVFPVSRHSAVFRFTSKDSSRGTPNPKGRGRTVWPKTWHTTMLAQMGETYEGPLRSVERAYTPVSSARDWENGKCELLIKVYSEGKVTSWLYNQSIGCTVWLSRPQKTLDVPSLVSDLQEATFKRPASVLLILGGTGVVAATQVLQHRDPIREGVAPAMTVPVSLIYSCRQDDVLLATDLVTWCKGQLDRCTLLITPSQPGRTLPFPVVEEPNLDEFRSLDNANVQHAHLTTELLAEEFAAMRKPCRIVVSGPESFNACVKQMLLHNDVELDAITTLSS